MMIINFDKLEEVLKTHNSKVSADIIERMVRVVLSGNHTPQDVSYVMAYATLKELGILDISKSEKLYDKTNSHLNS